MTEFRRTTMTEIIREVSAQQGVSEANIRSKHRYRSIVRARHMVCYVAREYGEYSYADIGREMGQMDHTSSMHSAGVIRGLVARDEELAAQLEQLKCKLFPRRCIALARAAAGAMIEAVDQAEWHSEGRLQIA